MPEIAKRVGRADTNPLNPPETWNQHNLEPADARLNSSPEGQNHSWAEGRPHSTIPTRTPAPTSIGNPSTEPLHLRAQSAIQELATAPFLETISSATARLQAVVRCHLLQAILSGDANAKQSGAKPSRKAAEFALPLLQIEAASFLPGSARTGRLETALDRLSGNFGITQIKPGFNPTHAEINGSTLTLLDYGDTLPVPLDLDILRGGVSWTTAQ